MFVCSAGGSGCVCIYTTIKVRHLLGRQDLLSLPPTAGNMRYSTKSLLNDNQQGSAMLWISLSLLASSALVVQHSVVHGQVFAVTMNSTTKVQNPRQNSA